MINLKTLKTTIMLPLVVMIISLIATMHVAMASSITVVTNQATYTPGSSVTISGNAPVSASVALEVTNPAAIVIFMDVVTATSAGTFNDSFALPTSAALGTYNVTASATAGKASTTFTVANAIALSVSISPASVTLDVGQSQNFTSTITGGTSPYASEWCLNGSAISAATGKSYTFTPSSRGHYNFYVNVTDNVNVKAQSNVATTTVNFAPSVKISPTSVTVNTSQSQLFTATASNGTSPYSYQWYLNGSAVSGATSATWTFPQSSAGSYTVNVKIKDVASAVATSNTATVKVYEATPEFPTAIPLIIMLFVVSALILTLTKRRRP